MKNQVATDYTAAETELASAREWRGTAFSPVGSMPQNGAAIDAVPCGVEEAAELPEPCGGPHSLAGHLLRRCRQPLLQFSVDVLALAGAWGAGLEARLALNSVMPRVLSRAELLELAPPLTAILALWVFVSAYRGAYCGVSHSSPARSLKEAADMAVLAGVLTVVVTFFSRQVGASLSRSFVLLFAPFSFLFLMAGRYLVLLAAGAWERRWPERVAILGYGAALEGVVERICNARREAVELAGVVLPSDAPAFTSQRRVPVLGRVDELASLVNRWGLDRILIVDGHLSASELETCTQISKRMGLVASRAVRPVELDSRVEIAERYGLHLLELRPTSFARTQQLVKRGLDIAVSATLLIVLSPVLTALALLVKLTSEGPVLYKASRVGRGGRHFMFLKFRSMYADAASREDLAPSNEHQGHLFKIRNDPRITPLGRFLRRSSLDELPQLINVLLGHMSLVGPRPLPAEDLDLD